MKEPVIQFNEKDFEENIYDPYIYLLYKGVLFTGTLLDEDGICYTEFEKGNAHGRSISYYKCGPLQSDGFFDNGNYVSGTEWYKNGQLKSDGTYLYNEDGSLICDRGSWLYPNGAKRNGKDGEDYLEFSPNGQLAIRTIINMTGTYKNTVIYYDKILSGCYHELLINRDAEHDSLFYNLEHKVWGWIMLKYKRNPSVGFEILNNLYSHPNSNIADSAKFFLEQLKKSVVDIDRYVDEVHMILA
ncbi:hypothetical protein OGH69_10075 [Flavobacterium sp. MFBS3-15]|uniref:hypothetical protein n=1 Tax=Flavobacterium sp. MFBS3-15 TaxID=2989816 RepID=UPI002236913E|nr:hypothetical protein [Flavobacterium sp. MFBS3-15]MCW4469312.1 hypothetical protein [Flavobacterium sp. MFBS3-15]